MDVTLVAFFHGFRRRWMLLAAVVVASWLVGIVYILVTPPRFSADVNFFVDDGLDSSKQSSGIAGLAASVGLGATESTGKEVAIATLKSRQLAVDFVQKYNLLPILFAEYWDGDKKQWKVTGAKIPTVLGGASRFMALRNIAPDTDSGTTRLTVTYSRPELVAWMANSFVKFGDEVLRQRALARCQDSLSYLQSQVRGDNTAELRASIINLMESDLQHITLVKTNGPYQLNIIDSAIKPDAPSWPRKGIILIGLTLFGLFASMLISMILDLRAGAHRRE